MAWDVIFYAAANGSVPADDFLRGCPKKVRARLIATLDAVAEAPPPRFSGGGQWEAMHGDMGGYYEVRAQGPGREQFRLFCILRKPWSCAVEACHDLRLPSSPACGSRG